MRYQADVRDIVYRYDGSFAGFLCCVFESYTRKEIPSEIVTPETEQPMLFEMRDISTEKEKARRVAVGLKRLGASVEDRVRVGFLSCAEGKDLVLLRFIRLCFAQGGQAAQMLGHTQVADAFALERTVNNEICRMIELLRFEEKDGMPPTKRPCFGRTGGCDTCAWNIMSTPRGLTSWHGRGCGNAFLRH